MNSTYITGGTLVDPQKNCLNKTNIFIEEGKIAHLGNHDSKTNKKTKIISANGKYIIPGLIDLRCHLKQPGIGFRESVEIISTKALSGGFTTILAMPELSSMGDNPETLKYMQESIIQENQVKILLSGCLTLKTQGKQLAPLGSLKESGIVAVTDCPNSPQDNQIYCKAVEYASMFDLPIIDLPRDLSLSPSASAHESLLSLQMGLKGFPRMAEELFVQRSILLSKYTKAKIHLTSISSGGSVNLIKQAKEENIPISCDVTSNHLAQTEKRVQDFDTFAKALPPFREEIDRVQLIEGLSTGAIDAVSSGHQAYSFDDKSMEYDLAPHGTIGLETAFLQALSYANGSTSEKLVQTTKKMCLNPSKILGLDNPMLKIGSRADFFIFDYNSSTEISRNSLDKGGCNLPFESEKFKGKIETTIIEGKQIYIS